MLHYLLSGTGHVDWMSPPSGAMGSRMHLATSLHPPEVGKLLRRFRLTLSLFIVGVVLSGLTCFALQREVDWLLHWRVLEGSGLMETPLGPWLEQVNRALSRQAAEAPFLFYGTDWLGFAHLVLALVFVGPLLHPVRNRWVIDFGLLACVGVLPLALIAGTVRGVPLFWQLVDCSFGVVGAAPLLLCRHYLTLEKRLRTTVAGQRRVRLTRRRAQRLPRTGARD